MESSSLVRREEAYATQLQETPPEPIVTVAFVSKILVSVLAAYSLWFSDVRRRCDGEDHVAHVCQVSRSSCVSRELSRVPVPVENGWRILGERCLGLRICSP